MIFYPNWFSSGKVDSAPSKCTPSQNPEIQCENAIGKRSQTVCILTCCLNNLFSKLTKYFILEKCKTVSYPPPEHTLTLKLPCELYSQYYEVLKTYFVN